MLEAELEARLRSQVKKVFPWINDDDIVHQLEFKIRLGRNVISIQNSVSDYNHGRLDVLIKHKNKPLAIIELKRPGISLTENDKYQALSYGRLHEPIVPVTMVTNGIETKIYNTFNGNAISDDSITEECFRHAVTSMSLVAEKGIIEAISYLCCSDYRLLREVLINISEKNFNEKFEYSANFKTNDPRKFLFTRKMTENILQKIKSGTKSILIHGEPLIGKTSILYELFVRREQQKYTILYIDELHDGIFDLLASILSESLQIPVSESEARIWVSNYSTISDELLVIAIDDISLENDVFIKEFSQITSFGFGDKISLVMTTSNEDVHELTTKRNGRDKTAMGKRALLYHLKKLDNEEFFNLCEHLEKNRIYFMRGANNYVEYRYLANISPIISELYEIGIDSDKCIILPSMFGAEIFGLGKSLTTNQRIVRLSQKLARAIIGDILNDRLPHKLKLYSLLHFSILSTTLNDKFDSGDIAYLEDIDFIKKSYNTDIEDDFYVIRSQYIISLYAKGEVENILASSSDLELCAKQLLMIANSLRFGDIIVASALCETSSNIQHEIVELFMRQKPEKVKSNLSGARIAIEINERIIEANADDFSKIEKDSVAYSDITAWTILSQMARSAIFAPEFYLNVGSSKVVLLRKEVWTSPVIHTHDFPDGSDVLCGKCGILESITLALYQLIVSLDNEELEFFCDRVLEKKSISLLNRTIVALGASATNINVDNNFVIKMEKMLSDALGNTALSCCN